MDHNTDPELELSVEALAKACKGDVSKLPSFMVHDNASWPWVKSVRPDNKNRLHIRRSTFLRCVVGSVPLRAGMWLRPDVQQFFIDLQPHHLGGGVDTQSGASKTGRVVVKADEAGRLPGEADYAEAVARSARRAVDTSDLAEVEKRDEKRSVVVRSLVDPSSE